MSSEIKEEYIEDTLNRFEYAKPLSYNNTQQVKDVIYFLCDTINSKLKEIAQLNEPKKPVKRVKKK
jgi:hypothetical protein